MTEQHDNDVDVLAPNAKVTIAGRAIVMREPSWVESLEIEHLIQPVVADAAKQLGDVGKPTPGDADRIARLMTGLIAQHKDNMLQLIAFCAGVDRAWIDALNDADGMTLMITFWRVNWHFFARRLNFARRLAGFSPRSVGAQSLAH